MGDARPGDGFRDWLSFAAPLMAMAFVLDRYVAARRLVARLPRPGGGRPRCSCSARYRCRYPACGPLEDR